MLIYEITASFSEAMLANGIVAPAILHATGKIERFYVAGDKSGTKNGWYVLFADGIPSGAYGSWRLGNTNTWSMKSKDHMSGFERSRYVTHMKEAIHQRDQLKAVTQKQAAQLAAARFSSYQIAETTHPYLLRKHIGSFCARQSGQMLVLPIIDFDGVLHSLQFISPEGKKTFLREAAVKGYFIPVYGRPIEDKQILICEGFATGASLAEMSPESCVVAACNAGNLKAVAINTRLSLPKAKIVICADCDAIGLVKGREAAIASGASFCRPNFPTSAPNALKDFNDYYCLVAG